MGSYAPPMGVPATPSRGRRKLCFSQIGREADLATPTAFIGVLGLGRSSASWTRAAGAGSRSSSRRP